MTEAFGPRGRIVVGVDGSPQSVAALRYARTLADALGHAVEVVGAWQARTSFEQYAPTNWDPEADARAVVDQAVREAFGDEPPAGLTVRMEMGSPTQVLINASEGAEMLVVGTRGRGGFKGMLLGSVSTSVASHAKCPVVIAHGTM
ncbi:universal stress protein [Zafaria cholistanensis]|uniref:Universal stress protein n=1 Tax=Zafaria cholistanensis TaxID=1682741 RepID=A0A5A7NRB2_9MICC|nr:universal stress protein [Zafaria cholistanensis]GER22662.1 universal stress protein [Zafaria cholistanensis]